MSSSKSRSETSLTLFDQQPTIALQDLTKPDLEAQAQHRPRTQRRHAKAQRAASPLLSLALVLDASVGVRKSARETFCAASTP